MDFNIYVEKAGRTDLNDTQYAYIYQRFLCHEGNAGFSTHISREILDLWEHVRIVSSLAESLKQKMFRVPVKELASLDGPMPTFDTRFTRGVRLLHGFIGLLSELGEVLEPLGNVWMSPDLRDSRRDTKTVWGEYASLCFELGDMGWYYANMVSAAAPNNPSAVLYENIAKLEARHGTEGVNLATIDPADGNRDFAAEEASIRHRDPAQPSYYSVAGLSPWEAYALGLLPAEHRIGYHKGDAIAYICRAGNKPGEDPVKEISKAIHHLEELKKVYEGKAVLTVEEKGQ